MPPENRPPLLTTTSMPVPAPEIVPALTMPPEKLVAPPPSKIPAKVKPVNDPAVIDAAEEGRDERPGLRDGDADFASRNLAAIGYAAGES